MDAFNVAYAPGVSAVNIQGLAPDRVFLSLIHRIVATGKLLSFDIAEVNPTYDIDGRTAKLAAFLAYDIICHTARLAQGAAKRPEPQAG